MIKYAIIFQLHRTGCVLIEFRVSNRINKIGSRFFFYPKNKIKKLAKIKKIEQQKQKQHHTTRICIHTHTTYCRINKYTSSTVKILLDIRNLIVSHNETNYAYRWKTRLRDSL